VPCSVLRIRNPVTSAGRSSTRARHKALLASPVHQDLLDTFGAVGPATARELAPQLGMRVSALYYHLQLLERAELVTRTISNRRDEAI
jgi:DNA-binding MarR family transcriptional regulator